MKKEHAIDASDLEILAALKSNPAMWSQVKRLAALGRDEDPSCRLADDAEDAIDRAGQVLKLESLRAWAQSSSSNAEADRARKQGGKRSKKNS
jgi:hypothetical protein